MSVRTQLLPILALLLLALGLTWLLPANAVARTAFQSNVGESPVGSPTVTPTAIVTSTVAVPRPITPVVPAIGTPTPFAPVAAPAPPPTSLPSPTPLPTPTEGVRGYLPPPTLTVRGAFAGGALPGSVVVGIPPSVSGPVDDPEPAPPVERSELASTIDRAVLLFGYGWLCGGIFLFLGAMAAFVWLVRAGAHRK